MVSPIESPKISRYLILLFLMLILGIGTAGYHYYEKQKHLIKQEKQNELRAICDLKVKQISAWRRERLGGAEVLFENYQFVQQLRQWLKSREKSAVMEEILGRISSFRRHFDYGSIFLLDEKGRTCLYTSEYYDEVGPYVQTFVKEAIESRKVMWVDLYRDETDRHIHLDILVPLVPREFDGLPSGVLLLRINPYKFLYSYIQTWPTPSPTAESLLIRREENTVLFLNELRHQMNTALTFRLPIVGKQSVPVRAVQGVEGVFEGVDYRDAEILAAVRPIPDSPWYLIAKVDHDEIYAPIRERAKFVILVVGILIISAGGILGILWRSQIAQFYRKQYEGEIERQALLKHFEYLTKYANDIIFLADQNWKIVEANDRALASYGYTRDEFLKMGAKSLQSPEEKQLFDKQFSTIDEQKGMVLEMVHQRQDGTTFPVEASIRVIEVEGGKCYRSIIIRNITERKQAEKEREKFIKIPVEYRSALLGG